MKFGHSSVIYCLEVSKKGEFDYFMIGYFLECPKLGEVRPVAHCFVSGNVEDGEV